MTREELLGVQLFSFCSGTNHSKIWCLKGLTIGFTHDSVSGHLRLRSSGQSFWGELDSVLSQWSAAWWMRHG